MPQQDRFDLEVRAISRTYRQVPFNVVTDWIQQGRLVAGDRVRPAGASEWQTLDAVPALSVYLPQAVPLRADDYAEAFGSIDLGFGGSRRADDEEDDPDMIPLIDISLVLLVFFMMTAGSMIASSTIDTPPAEYATVIQPRESLVVGLKMMGNQLRYSLGDGSEPTLSEQELLEQVAERVRQGNVAEAVVKAERGLPFETVQKLLIGLDKAGVPRIEAGVRDHKPTEKVVP
jgi:biopolymer transport protein ExbD